MNFEELYNGIKKEVLKREEVIKGEVCPNCLTAQIVQKELEKQLSNK